MMSPEHGSSLPTGEYEVFLSFRGPDVRQTFADSLYSCLVRSKIRTFRDEEELRRGETIGPSLIQAITESKIYIPILTQNYASSKWCFQELAKMVDCWKNGGGAKGKQHIILPVFYLIDPRDVRHPDSGSYKEAFEQHSLEHDPETILEWKDALQEVGKMKGWHVTHSDGHGAIIDKILAEVELHLRANYKLVTDELVGIDNHVDEVMKLLNLDSPNEKIVGIHGMGGLGKTTLAKAVYNKVSAQFERCCFLDNIRDMLSKTDGAIILQNKIISEILREDSYQARNASSGIRIIKERVCRHKLLIVLDDVDEEFCFDDILGELSNFSMDSRFLITTRDARVLEILEECKLFELEEMCHDHSLQLFSKHAFGGVDYPPKDYASLSKEFVQVAAGLPLAIKVIGSLLLHMDKKFWEAKLVELKAIPPTKVQERLKISYTELTYNEKQVFLDIACLFIGFHKEGVTYMWSNCDFYPESTIRSLIHRSLVKLDDKDMYWMHDHLRDLGRAIVREENNQNPCKRSRIWSNMDAIDMLKHKENLTRLRYLVVCNARLVGNFKDVLPNIRWLRMFDCESVPADLNLMKLVNLLLSGCSVTDGWKGWSELKVARKLKAVCLERCLNLKNVPDFSDCEGLEWLKFSECQKMHGELDIRNFKNLRGLEISNTKITKLKGEIGRLQHLQHLNVSQSSLIEVPVGISKLSSLEYLDLTLTHPNKTDITEMLPESVKILASSSSFLYALPSSLTHLKSCYCDHLPNVANLTNLLQLRFRDVGIDEILGLGELKLLQLLVIKELWVEGCTILKKLPSLATLTRLEFLHVESCPIISEIHGVGEVWESLSLLDVRGCSSLIGIEALQTLVKLEDLLAISNVSLEKFPDLSNLKNLRDLWINNCSELIEVTGLETLELLELLNMKGCRSIRKLPDLSALIKLATLNIRGCTQLTELRGLGRLESLEELSMSGCKLIKELPNLSGLKNLRILDIRKCVQLKEVNGIEELESLQVFDADTRLRVWYMLKSVSRYGKQLVTRSVPGALFMNN
ncbi:Disease resistance protein L6 [Linum perenne]